ncbi:MAG: toxin-antitoxin system, antitoxin component [Acidimicrobiia bacterium]
MSLSDYALAELTRSLERPTRQELIEALASRPERHLTTSPSAILREERDARAGG